MSNYLLEVVQGEVLVQTYVVHVKEEFVEYTAIPDHRIFLEQVSKCFSVPYVGKLRPRLAEFCEQSLDSNFSLLVNFV